MPSGWRVPRPPPLDELRGYYAEAESEFGVPWSVLAAIHFVETRFGRIHGDSHAGAGTDAVHAGVVGSLR